MVLYCQMSCHNNVWYSYIVSLCQLIYRNQKRLYIVVWYITPWLLGLSVCFVCSFSLFLLLSLSFLFLNYKYQRGLYDLGKWLIVAYRLIPHQREGQSRAASSYLIEFKSSLLGENSVWRKGAFEWKVPSASTSHVEMYQKNSFSTEKSKFLLGSVMSNRNEKNQDDSCVDFRRKKA